MFVINVILTVKDETRVNEVKELLREHGRLSRQEPDCVLFNVCHAENEPKVFVLNEHWASKKAWEIHKTAHAITTIFLPKVIPLVERQAYFCEMIS